MKIIFIGLNVPAKAEYSFTHDDADIGRVTLTMNEHAVHVTDNQFYHIFEEAKQAGQAFFQIYSLQLSMTQGYQIEDRLL